jgi:hypothetical protein
MVVFLGDYLLDSDGCAGRGDHGIDWHFSRDLA